MSSPFFPCVGCVSHHFDPFSHQVFSRPHRLRSHLATAERLF
ncbi:hypothetical protein [Oscillatoria acuminata]|nr:hypothetical protein [Oscillatoria acuminata]